MSTPVRIAVVGHTNVGKTSLLRTLTRDAGFGEVSSRPSTTRQVEGAALLVDGEPLVELYDTPGLEEPIALLEWIELHAAPPGERLDGPARIERFLAADIARQRFAQEAKVLRQLLRSDAGLLVIDVRDPVLGKHRDELALLAMAARPLLPVLNFVRGAATHEQAWREVLARNGLHAALRFDTVAPEQEAEARLYTALATVLHAAEASLQRLLRSRQREAAQRRLDARRQIAELLLDVAAARLPVAVGDVAAERAGREQLSAWVRAREQWLVDALLRLYHFEDSSVDERQLPLLDGRWAEDLFHPELLKQAGLRIGSGMAAGAAAGVGIDLLSAGLTLGAAATLGALAGGGVQALRQFGRRAAARLRGRRDLAVDDAILRLLAVRALGLQQALEGRGHAAQAPIVASGDSRADWREGRLPGPLRQAQAHPDWSSLVARRLDDEARTQAIDALAAAL